MNKMGIVDKLDDSYSVIYELNNHESQTPFTLGLYLDMKSVSDALFRPLLNMLTLKYKLTTYYCISSNRYVDTNDGQHELPYYELYGYNEKIATRTAKGRLEQSELKAFLDAHID